MPRQLMTDLFSLEELQAEIDAGYVTRKPHPELPLSILTYTRSAQYENRWNQVTTRCRGLVVNDSTGEIAAHCFPKFFSYDQHGTTHAFAPPVPNEPFEIYEKADGSLGIVFHHAGRWHVATKGSFTSDQAVWAQAWLDRRCLSHLDREVTYLAEIIYPENRIVVAYDDRTLSLLGGYGPDGREIPVDMLNDDWLVIGGTTVHQAQPAPLHRVVSSAAASRDVHGNPVTGTKLEGWVLRFQSGLRVKVKLADYVRLHKMMTGMSDRMVWQAFGAQLHRHQDPKRLAQTLGLSREELDDMLAGPAGPLDAMLENVPDEFDGWVRTQCAALETAADDLRLRIESHFAAMLHLSHDRRAFAEAARQVGDRDVTAALFQRLDGADISLHVWRCVRPAQATPFMPEETAA